MNSECEFHILTFSLSHLLAFSFSLEFALEFVFGFLTFSPSLEFAFESRRSPCSSAKASAHADAGFGSVGMSLRSI